jgi:fluoride ion exporter CrcB/FEX
LLFVWFVLLRFLSLLLYYSSREYNLGITIILSILMLFVCLSFRFSDRTGQHLAVYVFVLRCRSETAMDERRGYGLRLGGGDDDDEDPYPATSATSSRSGQGQLQDTSTAGTVAGGSPPTPSHLLSATSTNSRTEFFAGATPSPRNINYHSSDPSSSSPVHRSALVREDVYCPPSAPSRLLNEIATEREQPSIRAILTATAMLVLVCSLSSLHVFTSASSQQFAISLLFSPIGGLARWKITNSLNTSVPNFPLGTFTCNMLGCALSGSLGSFLAGSPGPEESIVLMSIINGFGGALSTLGSFVAEVLALIDPILFKFDGITYACVTIMWGVFVGLITVQSKDWADDIEHDL